MKMIIAGAEVGALAAMVVCNDIFGCVLMASFHSVTETIVIGGCAKFDHRDKASWKYADF